MASAVATGCDRYAFESTFTRIDAILASTPLMFVSVALTAARLDGKSISDNSDGLEQTLLLSPTIFPLIFAALMGGFFPHLGVYLA
jgi:hypothetical protein